jgi:hypothetical protein
MSALRALRGDGVPDDPDIMYGSIYAAPDATETVVGLQEKLLHMLNLLQAADAKPTTQAREAVAALLRTLAALEARWAALR